MEENQDLQDIVLERDEENQGSKARKIVTTIISLIILFLIVVIVVKFLNSSDEEPAPSVPSGSLILPEEPVSPAPAPEAYEQVPISVEPAIPEPAKEPNEPRETKEPVNIELEPTKPIIEPQPEKKVEPKQVEKKAEPKPEPKQEPKKNKAEKLEQKLLNNDTKATSTTSATSGTYIQVSSISKVDENNALFKKLRSAGYSYKTHSTTINGKSTIKVLVGPFDNAGIKENLDKIKSIAPGAFVYKIK